MHTWTPKELQQEITRLRRETRRHEHEEATEERVRREIIGLAATRPTIPKWLLHTTKARKSPGVPTLFLTDLHWGERVDPAQVGGCNAYSLPIARRRLRTVITSTVDLLRHHVVCPRYPGIVVALGGDMMSGSIHEELTETNDAPIMPCLVDLLGHLIAAVQTLRDAFGQVYIPAVTGNHGRTTHKPRAKGRAYSSYDWLVYHLLARHYAGDARVRFRIADGPDCLYRIYGWRYLLTHGDQFRGGDGLIGPLGPLTRGNHKKASRNVSIGMGYDTLLVGHFHQCIQLQRLIVGGSLKGTDEYAYALNVPHEPPRQALWLTHPTHGITISMPVLAEPSSPKGSAVPTWVSWRGA